MVTEDWVWRGREECDGPNPNILIDGGGWVGWMAVVGCWNWIDEV